MKNIEKSIGQYFNGHRNSHISSLLDFIAKTYELDILNNSDKGQLYSYDIRGEHNYEIISRTIFTLIRMEQENIISYHKQEGGAASFKNISYYNGTNINCAKISGDMAQYINSHLSSSIYVNSSISHFAKYGFMPLELVLNTKQNRISKWTLLVSIFALFLAIVSFVIPFCK
jgi:hypothetical protein